MAITCPRCKKDIDSLNGLIDDGWCNMVLSKSNHISFDDNVTKYSARCPSCDEFIFTNLSSEEVIRFVKKTGDKNE
jgi:phage FluMu protein Com